MTDFEENRFVYLKNKKYFKARSYVGKDRSYIGIALLLWSLEANFVSLKNLYC